MKDVTKKQPTSCSVGYSVTGDGYGVWCYAGRMNGPCFWPKMLDTMCGKEGLERAIIRSVGHFFLLSHLF